MNFNWKAILEMIFSAGKLEPIKPKPDPVPDPPKPDPPKPTVKKIIIADLETIPDKMRAQGFPGRDNLLWYALATTYMGGNWGPVEGDPESYILHPMVDKIYEWWDSYVVAMKNQLEINPLLTAKIIVNDGPDRLGFRLGPACMDRLKEFGVRVEMGVIYE